MGNKNISDLENQLDSILESLSDTLLNQKESNIKHAEEIKYFCEKKVIKNIIILSSYRQKEINLKIIKYISIFISNSSLKSEKNEFNFFNHICENKYLNQLIINLNITTEEKDDDYLSYYINFLKVINNRINIENINLIFNTKHNIFPLLDQILFLLNNDDIMIRNSARNIILSLIKLNYVPLIEYLCDTPRIAIFIILMRKIKTNILLMINLKNIEKNIYVEKTKEFKEKIVEDLLFMQDILSINIYKINYIIINCFLSIVISFLFSKMISFSVNKNSPNINSEISKSINIFRIIFKNIKNESIKNILCFLIFSKKVFSKINQYLINGTNDFGEIKNDKVEITKMLNHIYYNFNYNYSQMKFEDFIIYNYSSNFLKSLRYIKQLGLNEKMIFNEIQDLSNLLRIKEEKDDLQIIIQFLNEKLVNNNNNFIKRMYNFHYFNSQKTGINCGIYQQEENESFLSILYTNFSLIQNQQMINNTNYFQNNILRKEILNFFSDEIKGNNIENKNGIFNIILLFIEIVYDKNINIAIKEMVNIKKKNNINNKIENINNKNNISNDIVNSYNNNQKSIIYPNKIKEPINKEDYININKEKVEFNEVVLNNNFLTKIDSQNYSFNINDNSDLIINIIDFVFYPKFDLNNNDILLCFRLIEKLYNESCIKYVKIEHYMKALLYNTLKEIKEILLKNNYDLKNGIFKFAYSLFEKAFYSNKKNISDIIQSYYNDMKLSSFIIVENSPNLKEKSKLKNLFQKYISLHDLIINNSFLFKNIEFPLKLIKKEQNFEIGGKIDIAQYNLTKMDIRLIKIANNNPKEEYLTMFIYNNYLFFALSPENVANFDINAIIGEKLYLIKYMFCLRYINLIKDIGNNTLLFIFDENEYKFNMHIKFENNNVINKAKELLFNGINNSIILEFSSISSFINNQIVELNKILDKNIKI